MSPLFFLSQVEVLLANDAPKARIQTALANVRQSVEMLEIELDRLRALPARPQENTASIPAVLTPDLKVPLDPPSA